MVVYPQRSHYIESTGFSKELVGNRNRIERALVKALEEATRSGSVLKVLAARLALN